jgi:glutaminyl-peptide cyclotransferase
VSVSDFVTPHTYDVKRRQPAGRRAGPKEMPRPAGSPSGYLRRWRWSVVSIAAGLVVVMAVIGWLQTRGGASRRAPTHRVAVVNAYPHDPQAYCQGLAYRDGFLYEGTGQYGASSVRKVELETGRVVQQHDLDRQLFGEGITLWENELIQLTWKSRQAIVYDLETFQELRRHAYRGQGWGLTHDGRSLIMSDGTATLRFVDPRTFAVTRQLVVREGNRRISHLNELEYVDGEILANIWYEDYIARISPESGQVLGWIDLTGLFPASRRPHEDAVANGIAYDEENRRLFVTGKNWPQLFEIRVVR